MRGEELRGCRNLRRPRLLALPEPGENLVFPLGDVELVEPADHLDIAANLSGERRNSLGEDGIRSQKVRGDEKFGVVALALEHERHRAVPVAAVLGE